MKKALGIILIVLGIFILILTVDTAQAKIFDNKPLIKVVENYNGGNFSKKSLYQKHKGVLVNSYIYADGTTETVFKWEKYSPHEERLES